MTIKKEFVQIYDLLQTNPTLTVEDILPQALELMSKKRNSAESVSVSRDGIIVGLYCSYFQRWFPTYGPNAMEFTRRTTATGFHSQCAEALVFVRNNKKTFEDANLEIINSVMSGEILAEEGRKLQEKAKLDRDKTLTHSGGFATKQELENAINEES